MKIVHFTIFALFVTAYSTLEENLASHHILKVIPSSEDHLHFLNQLKDDADFWNDVGKVGQPVLLHVNPQNEKVLTGMLTEMGIPFSIDEDNVEMKIKSFFKSHHASRSKENAKDYDFDRYLEYDEIEQWLVDTAARCTNGLKCSVENIGKTFEDRDMWVLKVGKTVENEKKIWIDGGIHAREWVAPSTVMFSINSLIDGYLNNDQEILKIFGKYDFYFLPVVNPDGYQYSHTTQRLWRKNRRPIPGSSCVGVDLNRNFNHMWGEIGCSLNPCSDTFCGTGPLSEIEANNLHQYMMGLGGGSVFDVFITMHSYSQLWMSPWGYTVEIPDDHDDLIEAGNVAVDALTAVHGTRYTVGPASHILYTSSGTSRDWAKGVPKIKYVYTIELRDTGLYGFLLPPEQIRPTGEETWAGLKAMFIHIIDKPGNKKLNL